MYCTGSDAVVASQLQRRIEFVHTTLVRKQFTALTWILFGKVLAFA